MTILLASMGDSPVQNRGARGHIGAPLQAPKERAVVVRCDPIGNRSVVRSEATSGVTKCNEALRMARDAVAIVRRLALVAQNALRDGDLRRVCAILQDLQDATSLRLGREASEGRTALDSKPPCGKL
jgi:hypothetical protein